MTKRLSESVVVITGASSGIGRATALECARKGATVVLAARGEEGLQTAARECEAFGARTLVVPTDTSDEEAVKNLARQAIDNFGRIDVWVNDAAVSLFGRFEESPMDVYRQVIETNLFGYILGARAAIAHFRKQGSGVLINVASVVAGAPQPYTSAYVTSKYAVRALGASLRMELSLDQADDIHVCTVMPATIDTPLFQHAANYTGRGVKPLPPVYPAEHVARTIAALVENPQREVVVGSAGRVFLWLNRVAPSLYEYVAARQVNRSHLTEERTQFTPGNVFSPMPQYASVSGGWLEKEKSSLGAWVMTGLAVAVPMLLYWAGRRLLPAARPQPSLSEKVSSVSRRIPELLGVGS